ncbi:long-chain-acyl-CoA synthetase [Gordonia terrae]
MTAPPVFSAWDVYPRMIAKFLRPIPLRGLLALRKLSDDDCDSIGALLERRAAQTPHAAAFRNEEGELTWRAVNDGANRTADVLASRGVAKGDVVAVALQNRQAWITTVMGAMKLGAIVALINTEMRGASLEHCVTTVQPKALVLGEEQIGAVEGGVERARQWSSIPIYVRDQGEVGCPDGWLDLATATGDASPANRPEVARVTFADPAVYVFTSGTTGLPKASITAHRRLFMGCILSGRVLREMGPTDCVYAPVPLYHVTGLMGGWISCIYSGATFATARKFSASRYWDEVRRYDATTVIYIGELLRYLYNQPPTDRDRDHKVTSMTGAGLRDDIWDDFKQRFGIERVFEVYGASESPGGFVNVLNLDRTSGWCPTKWETVAFDVDRNEIIRGADGYARPQPKGETGLMLFEISEHSPFTGYTDPAASERKIIRNLFAEGDQWFDSGDLVLNQGHGHMKFVDRTGDTFRWRGENVATTQVEDVIDAWPQVAQSAVYGVEVPGTEGRCGMARIVTHPDEKLDLAALAEHLRRELPPFAVPRFLRLGSELEVTGTFKLRKVDLKAAGFRPDAVDEPAFALLPDESDWRELTPSLADEIGRGNVRL